MSRRRSVLISATLSFAPLVPLAICDADANIMIANNRLIAINDVITLYQLETLTKQVVVAKNCQMYRDILFAWDDLTEVVLYDLDNGTLVRGESYQPIYWDYDGECVLLSACDDKAYVFVFAQDDHDAFVTWVPINIGRIIAQTAYFAVGLRGETATVWTPSDGIMYQFSVIDEFICGSDCSDDPTVIVSVYNEIVNLSLHGRPGMVFLSASEKRHISASISTFRIGDIDIYSSASTLYVRIDDELRVVCEIIPGEIFRPVGNYIVGYMHDRTCLYRLDI